MRDQYTQSQLDTQPETEQAFEIEETADPDLFALMQFCEPSRKDEFVKALMRLYQGKSFVSIEIPVGGMTKQIGGKEVSPYQEIANEEVVECITEYLQENPLYDNKPSHTSGLIDAYTMVSCFSSPEHMQTDERFIGALARILAKHAQLHGSSRRAFD